MFPQQLIFLIACLMTFFVFFWELLVTILWFLLSVSLLIGQNTINAFEQLALKSYLFLIDVIFCHIRHQISIFPKFAFCDLFLTLDFVDLSLVFFISHLKILSLEWGYVGQQGLPSCPHGKIFHHHLSPFPNNHLLHHQGGFFRQNLVFHFFPSQFYLNFAVLLFHSLHIESLTVVPHAELFLTIPDKRFTHIVHALLQVSSLDDEAELFIYELNLENLIAQSV